MHGCKEKNINTKIISFIPKHEKKQRTALVNDPFFLLFSVNFNKQNALVNNDGI